jgi:tRNA (guanine-N7-)-methyltransferase
MGKSWMPGAKRGQTSMNESQNQRAERAFFGRRKGRLLRPRQAGLLDTLLPRLAVDLSKPAPADLAALFAQPIDEVRLEIGFGGGEHLIAQAHDCPRTGFIGSDAFLNAMAKVLTAIDQNAVPNIRLHFGDATQLIDWLPRASLARVDLLYPDPWPKRRHWKRRFVQDESINNIARILRSGAEFRFATDIPDYAAWTLTRMLRSPDFTWTAECADDWRQSWPGFTGTRYEAKAKREMRVPCYLIFRRN